MIEMVLQIPERFKGLMESVQSLIHTSGQLLDQLCQGKGVDYAAVETSVAQQASAIERATHQALLSALDIDAPWIQVAGVVHARAGRYAGTYYTLAGPVQVERSLYRPVDQRNAKTIDPVSVRAGVVGAGWLPATARAMASELGNDGTFIVTLSYPGLARGISGWTMADEVTQAVRAARALQKHVPAGSLALVTGRGLPASGPQYQATIERAARLLDLASGPGVEPSAGLWLDELTAGLLDTRFVVRAADDRPGAFVLERERAGLDEVRPLLGRATPYVGRTRELRVLELLFQGGLAEGEARGALVSCKLGARRIRGCGRFKVRFSGRQRPRRGDAATWPTRAVHIEGTGSSRITWGRPYSQWFLPVMGVLHFLPAGQSSSVRQTHWFFSHWLERHWLSFEQAAPIVRPTVRQTLPVPMGR